MSKKYISKNYSLSLVSIVNFKWLFTVTLKVWIRMASNFSLFVCTQVSFTWWWVLQMCYRPARHGPLPLAHTLIPREYEPWLNIPTLCLTGWTVQSALFLSLKAYILQFTPFHSRRWFAFSIHIWRKVFENVKHCTNLYIYI